MQNNPVDAVFHALAHPTRRAVVERLGRGPASMTELNAPFGLALPSLDQHLRVLEQAGLVRSHKRGRVRTFRLDPAPLQAGERWLAEQCALWTRRLDQLDHFLLHVQEPTE